MSITLADLVASLQAQVQPLHGVPTDYAQIVDDAVLQLATDTPLVRTVALDVQPGVGSYPLPGDFLFVVSLDSVPVAGDVLVTDGGLVPVPGGFVERYSVEGDALVLQPVPGYRATRTLRYAARYALEGGAYAHLTQNGARIALLYAQYLALSQQAAHVARDAWRYQIGTEQVDKGRQSEALRGAAEAVLNEYRRAVTSQQAYGRRPTYGLATA